VKKSKVESQRLKARKKKNQKLKKPKSLEAGSRVSKGRERITGV
jgi:hypothetical protein